MIGLVRLTILSHLHYMPDGAVTRAALRLHGHRFYSGNGDELDIFEATDLLSSDHG